MANMVPYRQIRACYTSDTITVYQAYKESIATAAVAAQRLDASADFRPGRMTWIKPSWCWIMYRAGYSYKDPGQARILALTMKHEHFVGLLERGVLASNAATQALPKGEKTCDVRVQWDPERTPALDLLPYRSIQIGIPGALSGQWARGWIVGIEDVTDKARQLKKVLDEQPEISTEELVRMGLVPNETPYHVPESVISRLDMTPLTKTPNVQDEGSGIS